MPIMVKSQQEALTTRAKADYDFKSTQTSLFSL